MSANRTLSVPYLARVEGEGAMHVRIKDGRVENVEVRIFEPPRFFEAFLRGRMFLEAPDITARICGICPVAYQMSAVHALEAALGIQVDGPLRDLRRLLYCGEWIESHALHVYMLHAPDFLGYPSVVHMAADHPQLVNDALALKRTGNQIMTVVGGREIHPINVKVGGFYHTPTKAELDTLVAPLERALETAVATARFAATLTFPELTLHHELIALRHPDDYPMNEGRLVSDRGLDISAQQYQEHFAEEHAAHSNALHSHHKGTETYLVGPLARMALNRDRLTPLARRTADEIGLETPCRNPFRSILVRAVELVLACEEALRLIRGYREPREAAVAVAARKGIGWAMTEAPRGMLYHRYCLDDHGLIEDANIVPPTSQNLRAMEADLRAFVTAHLHLDDAELTLRCEQAIRNYDPCISCATHFLKLDVARS